MALSEQPQSNPDRLAAALRRIDEENARDPNQELVNGKPQPRELVYSQWLTNWVVRLAPTASEELRLAARAQHVCRWLTPRDSYPMTRPGYLRWRQDLKQSHAKKTAAILREIGYPEPTIDRVQELIKKQRFPDDPESRVLEDALCLVFLEHQLAPLAAKTSEEKVINAVQKSWKKMTPAAREIAKSFAYHPQQQRLLLKAIGELTGEG